MDIDAATKTLSDSNKVIWQVIEKEHIDYEDKLTDKQWEAFVERIHDRMAEAFTEIVQEEYNIEIDGMLLETANGPSDEDDRFVECDECEIQIDCHKNSTHIVYKGEASSPTEEMTLCTMCFQDMEDELIENDYLCDDWE